MRLIFFGTPLFAVPSLERVAAAGHEVAAVITQPDRPRGRGQELGAPAVKEAAERLGLRIYQPEKIRTPEFPGFLQSLTPEAMIVVGYGRIIPQTIIDIPARGIINVHASLLPRYRGAAPIQWAIAGGESVTGVTTMRIDAGLDTGDILLQEKTTIGEEESAIELGTRLAAMGADLLVHTLTQLGEIVPRKQDPAQATLAPVLTKEDGRIDWTRPARDIHNRIRGFVPWPGCYARFRGRLLHVWRARVADSAAGEPGALLPARNRLIAACGGGGALELLEVQPEGKKRMSASAFLNGYRLEQNEKLEMAR